MRVLATGALGFIGRHFLLGALAAGITVSAFNRTPTLPKRSLAQQFQSRGVSFHEGDVENPDSLPPAMDGVDSVCHFASAFRESGMAEEYFIRVNVDGTRNVMQAAGWKDFNPGGYHHNINVVQRIDIQVV